MLLDGRSKGFFIDISFRMLHPMPSDAVYLRFAAEETHSKRRVVVRILASSARPREEPPTFEIDDVIAPET
jgi:hypothetical protein